MRQRLMAVFVATALAGCASSAPSPGTTSAAGAPVTLQDAKAALANSRHVWKDPDSIRDTRIGQPFSCIGHLETVLTQRVEACICVAANAKNSFGGYTGLKNQVALLQGGRVIDLIPARMGDQCSNLVPWPEFDGRQR